MSHPPAPMKYIISENNASIHLDSNMYMSNFVLL